MANYNSDYTGAQIDSAVSRANSTDVTAGTVAASKAVVVDSNKDITGFRHITATGTVTAANVSLTGNVDLGDASGDTVTITGSIDSNLIPAADDTYDIGSSSYAWQDIYLEGDIYLSDATEIDVASGNLTVDVAGDIEINADGGDITFKDASSTLAAIDSSGDFNVAGSIETATIDYTDGDLAMTIADGGGVTFAQTSSQVSGSTIGNVTIANGSITDSSGTISLGDENLTTTGVGTFASLDISGNADIDGTMEADAYTVDGTALNEYIADTVGAMVGSNTETNITVTYEDSDNTLDFVIGTLNQDTTGTADNITVSANNSSDETVYPIFVDGATGSQGAESDTGLTYNPSSGLLTSTLFAGTLNTAAQGNVTSLGTLTALTVDNIAIDGTTIGHTGDTDLITLASGVVTVAGEVDATSLDISGDADIDGTLEADAITVDGTTLAEYISDTTGAMFSSNTESGITVTYQDGDNTIDLSVDAAQTGITSLLATDIKIGEDDQTKIDFEDADKINFYAGNEKQLILEDGALYPGSDNIIDLGKSDNEFKDAFFDGTVTADAFAGPITGAVTGNADTATLATTVTVTDSSANTDFPVVFHNESNGLLDDTGALRYNPSTGELLVPKLTVAGTTTTVDTVTMNAQNAIVFEGATADSNETTLSIVDPTSDHTQYLINQGGYIPVLATATTTAISATPEEINLIDGGTARGTTAVASGDGILINDGGTMRMTNVDTVSTYFSSHNVGGSNIVTTGALNSGSITSGFGTIDTGSSNITTTGVGAFGSLDISGNVDVDGTLEADAITVDSVALATYIRDTVGTNMVSSNTESGITVTYDTTNDNIDFAVDASQTGLTSILNASLVTGRDADNQIKFSTDDEIIFRVAGGDGVTMKASGEIEATSLDISGAIDVDGTANLDAVDIDGAVQIDSTLTVGVDDTGHDVKFFGATATNGYMLWDESTDDLILGSASKMGIGNTSPTVKLQITGDSNEEDVILLEDNSGNDVGALRIHANAFILKGKHSTSPVQIQTHDGNEDIEVDPDGFIKFETAGSEAMRIDSSQNVGIGTSLPGDYNSSADNLVIYEATNVGMTIASGTAGTGSIYFADGTSGDSEYRGFIQYVHDSSDVLRFGTAASTRMTIDSSGRVGIGTSSPANTLVVQNNNDAGVGATINIINDPGSSTSVGTACKLSFSPHHSGTEVANIQGVATGTGAQTALTFSTHNGSAFAEKMRITADGRLGIGETSPQGPLHVRSADSGATVHVSADEIIAEGSANAGISILTGTSDEGAIYFGDSGDNDIGRIRYAHSSNKLDFRVNALINMTLDGTNVGIGEASPDEMLHLTSGISGKPRIILENTNNDTQGPAIILKKSTTDEADGDELGDISWQAMDENHAMTEFGFIRVTAADVTYDSENGTMSFYTTVNAASAARLKINDDGSITHQGAGGAITTDSDGSTLSFSKDATNTIKTTGASSVIHIIAESNGVSLANSGTSWGSLSDERLKENWSYFDNALDKINTLTKIGTYNPIDRETKKVDEDCVLTGLSADEVKKILPTAITEDEEGYKVLQYQDVFVLMLKSIQELSAKVEALESA